MKRYLLVALVAGLFGLAAALVVNGPGPIWRTELGQRALHATMQKAPDGVLIAKRGEPLPAIALQTLDGTRLTLPLPEGRPALINVWATWCPPCVKEMPMLAEFARAEGDSGVQVIGVALDDADAIHAWLQRLPSPYPHYRDDPGKHDAGVVLGNPAGVMPYTVLVAADGRVLKQRIGPFDSVDDIAKWSDTRH
ncbi:MAG: TlpA disulfide reductase family protein [Pseudomonadota bacterium]|nr:TlpA disulfide reductase family protein [Pseudomonadota bacterium]